MENKSKGKTIAIVILVLIVLGLAGYIVYDKVMDEKKNEEDKTTQKLDVNKENNEEQSGSEKVNITGLYKYGQIYNIDATECKSEDPTQEKGFTFEILINSNGSYEVKEASDCADVHTSKGTYTFDDNKLVLKCDTTFEEDCIHDGEYQINEFGTLSNSENNLFSKVTKEQLQLFK